MDIGEGKGGGGGFFIPIKDRSLFMIWVEAEEKMAR